MYKFLTFKVENGTDKKNISESGNIAYRWEEPAVDSELNYWADYGWKVVAMSNSSSGTLWILMEKPD